MVWTLKFDVRVEKTLKKLDRQAVQRIRNYLENQAIKADDPRQLGKSLAGQLETLWRYRVGNYRIICEIQDQELIVLVVRVGHRSDVYR